jgi:Fuc2NAc and GlcNAc transferase
MDVFLILIFSVGGFLFWNWPKARIFMGDAGSITLGFILIVFGIYFHNNGSFHFVFWLILTALFWFDATITLLRRIMNREKLSQAHKKHMYQRAIRGGFSHLTTLISGFGINILLFLICVMIWKKYIPLIFGLIMTILILGASMIYIERKFNFKKNS